MMFWKQKNAKFCKQTNKKFWSAATRGNLTLLRSLFNENPELDINWKNKKASSFTALHQACRSGDVKVLNFLTSSGAALSPRGHNDVTPLHLAAGRGHLEVVKHLVHLGTELTPITKEVRCCSEELGFSALHFAIKHGHYDVVKFLIDSGAPFILSGSKVIPLDMACRLHRSDRSQVKIVKLLLSRGADVLVDQKTPEGYWRLSALCGSADSSEELIKLFIQYGADPSARHELNGAPVLIAAEVGNLNVVRFLVMHGADLLYRERNIYSYTALRTRGDREMITFIDDHISTIEQSIGFSSHK
eukprot:TRINITY_DN2193_c0_g1_i3.p1 TRINITY_DN2193_c0_g1~~TRINITY_DN2193_c0_g1_i3.p1  ORF type:complete len:302 (+),score=29.09 TRINITY_DN2193_c0_g1_i3:109-1014(+)